MLGGWAVVFAVLGVLPAFISAQASTWFLERTETQFSVTLANDSSDVFIYFESPAYSWVAVGFGEQMKGSLSFVMYLNKDGDNLTISPRIGDGNREPSFTNSVQIETLNGTRVDDDLFILRAVCRNCRSWPGGSIDENSTQQPMIYAFGPGNILQSNSPSADLKRHVRYEKFTMDMVAATGVGEVPPRSQADNGVTTTQGLTKDHDRANRAHSVMGCIAIFVLWPINILFAGFLRNIRIHIGMSIFLVVFLAISFVLGIITSHEYNRTKSFASPHQILSFITLAPLLALSLLPLPPLRSLTPHIPSLHAPLTTFTLALFILVGGLGLQLSGSPRTIALVYTAISLFVFIFCLAFSTCIKRRGSAYARATQRRRLGEDDDRDLALAEYYAQRKMELDSRSASQASVNGHVRTPSGNIYGGGTMPGPQYLMNMHPGVPVHRWSQAR